MPAPKHKFSTDYPLYALLGCIVNSCAIHPNVYTSIGAALIPVILYYMHKKDKWMVLFFMVLRFVLDCLDGLVARKCDLGTEFGKNFDLITDHICISTAVCLWLYQITGNIQAVAALFILIWLSVALSYTSKDKGPGLLGEDEYVNDNALFFVCMTWFAWCRSLKL